MDIVESKMMTTTLLANKSRSSLTMLGIIIGTLQQLQWSDRQGAQNWHPINLNR